MSYFTLKIIHLTGLALVFMGLAGVLALKMAGDAPFKKRRLFHLSHGLGLILLLASGIALTAQLGLHPLPGWVKAKYGVWLLAGAAMAAASRLGRFAGPLLTLFAGLVATAAWLAITKPF